jgi:hypothetical protein
MITKGWGVGNCFYLGVALNAAGKHRFQCRNMGALAKSAVLQLAFQFSLSNTGKTYTNGAANAPDKQIVKQVAKKLTCELKINTWASATTSTVNWYQAKFEVPIDGDT